MKYSLFAFIFLCTIFSLVPIGCENTELQKSLPKDDERITTRTIECEDCPEEDCCCGVQLLSNINSNLELCGTSSPDNTTTACGPTYVGNCTIVGYILNLALNGIYDTELFCMPQNRAFSIKANSTGTYRISCQAGQIGPQSIDVNIPANSTAYITVNEACEVALCH